MKIEMKINGQHLFEITTNNLGPAVPETHQFYNYAVYVRDARKDTGFAFTLGMWDRSKHVFDFVSEVTRQAAAHVGHYV